GTSPTRRRPATKAKKVGRSPAWGETTRSYRRHRLPTKARIVPALPRSGIVSTASMSGLPRRVRSLPPNPSTSHVARSYPRRIVGMSGVARNRWRSRARVTIRMRGRCGRSSITITYPPVECSGVSIGFAAPERLIRRLLDQARARCDVDRLLHTRALIIQAINGACVRYEGISEVSTRVAFSDRILDVPKLRVDALELFAQVSQHGAVDVAQRHGTQRAELTGNIIKLAGVFDALGFEFKNGDLVYQLADRDRDQDVLRTFHAMSPGFAGGSVPCSTIPPQIPTPMT